MSRPKTYLGDSVYAEYRDGQLLLTVENGWGATQTIVLEAEVLAALVDFLELDIVPRKANL